MTKILLLLGTSCLRIFFTNEVAPAVNICEIPPAIVERFIQHSAQGFTQTLNFGGVGEVFTVLLEKTVTNII